MHRLVARSALALLLTASFVSLPMVTHATSTTLVISQVYGGGGNSGAPYHNDYIEIFNLSASPVSVAGWSVQYASATGSTWSSTPLSGSIPAGGYYLVQEAAGAGGGAPLPTPDATGSISMSSTTGKVALVSNTTVLSGTCPTGGAIVDFVGYGSTANCFEGTGPTPTISNTLAAFRGASGCTDTDDNLGDFATGAPNPRNSASAAHSCFALSGVGFASPDLVHQGGATLLTVVVTPAQGPPSTGITVTGDLGTIGGSATQMLFDDGTNGDATAGDNTFSYQASVPGSVTLGAKSLPIDIADAEARTASTSISLTVVGPAPGPGDIVISQVYGGGGNTGAPYTNDFIELFNRSATTWDLAGLSIQYASINSSSWLVSPLTGSLAPGQYFLIQEASGGAVGNPLPTPDLVPALQFAMSAVNAKVALSSSTLALTGTCPVASGTVIDFVGYGLAADCYEGAAGTNDLGNATAALRLDDGCMDTGQNGNDFAVGAPNPRNTATPTHLCATDPTGVGAASPGTVPAGSATLLSVAVTPGTLPASTGLAVTGDLSSIGGSATETFYDDGTHGDATAGDNIFSYSYTVPPATIAGGYSLPFLVTDAESRSGSGDIALTVTGATSVDPGALRFGLELVGHNPSRSLLQVAFTLPSSARARLAVLDVTGRAVFSRDVAGDGRHQIEVGTLRSGVYLVRLTQGSRSEVRRAAVLR
jgi:hypothetical protein